MLVPRLCLIAILALGAAAPRQTPKTRALVGGTLIDGFGGRPIPMNFHSHSTWRELDAWVSDLGVDPMTAIRATSDGGSGPRWIRSASVSPSTSSSSRQHVRADAD